MGRTRRAPEFGKRNRTDGPGMIATFDKWEQGEGKVRRVHCFAVSTLPDSAPHADKARSAVRTSEGLSPSVPASRRQPACARGGVSRSVLRERHVDHYGHGRQDHAEDEHLSQGFTSYGWTG